MAPILWIRITIPWMVMQSITGTLINTELEFSVSAAQSRRDCITFAIGLDAQDLLVLQEKVPPLAIMDPKRPAVLPKDSKCWLALIDGKNQKSAKLQKISEMLKEYRHVNTFVFLQSIEGYPVLENANYIVHNADDTDTVQIFTKCPNQDLKMVRAWKQYQPEMMFSRMQCDIESLKDKTLNVSYGNVYPLSVTSEQGEAVGMEPAIIKMAANYLGFKPNFVFESLWFSDGNTSNEVGGIYGKVSSGVSDLGMGGTSMFHSLDNLKVSYSWQLYNMEMIFITSGPKPLKSFFNIVNSFDQTVWILLSCAIGIVVILMSAILLLFDDHQRRIIDLLFEACMVPVGCLLFQTVINARPKQRAMVILLAFWMINTAFVHYFFDSNLRAYLIKIEFTKPIDNANDLLETKTPLYLPYGTGVMEALQFSTLDSHRHLFKRAERDNTFYHLGERKAIDHKVAYEGGARVTLGKLAPFVVSVTFKNYKDITVHLGKDALYNLPGTIVMRRGAPWGDKFNMALARVFEAGIPSREFNSYVSNTMIHRLNEKPIISDLQSFTLQHVAAGFIVLLSGIACALGVFLCELIGKGCWFDKVLAALYRSWC